MMIDYNNLRFSWFKREKKLPISIDKSLASKRLFFDFDIIYYQNLRSLGIKCNLLLLFLEGTHLLTSGRLPRCTNSY